MVHVVLGVALAAAVALFGFMLWIARDVSRMRREVSALVQDTAGLLRNNP